MKRIKRWFHDYYPLVIPVGIFLFYIFLCWCHTESYCWFWPSIDTRFSEKFSRQAFSSVIVGMTTDEVKQRLGVPRFGIDTEKDGSEKWWYTDDGNCIVAGLKLADFAWIGYYLTISNNVVIGKTRQVFYD